MRIKEEIHVKAIVDVSGGTWGRVFLFYWEIPRKSSDEIIVSSKAVPEVLNLKYRSEFKHCFANRGCFRCTILEALHSFKEKRVHKVRDSKCHFKMFKIKSSKF